MSISKGFAQAIHDSVEELDCRSMQIFLKSPRGGKIKPLLESDIDDYQAAYKKHNFEFVVGHSSYLLNLAKDLDSRDNWQFRSLLDDFQKLEALNGKGLVYHVGKYLQQPYDEAEAKLVENLKQLLDQAYKYGVPLLLENCAGQGSEMGTSLQQVQSVLDKVRAGDQLKVCLDTCHAFAAGYNLADPKSVEEFFAEIEATITFEKVVCFHLNDSKTPLKSNRDRHENIGQGFIGKPGLQKFVEMANIHQIPLILETPLINNSHLIDANEVKSWV